MQEKNNCYQKKSTSQLELVSAKVNQNDSKYSKWHPTQVKATTIPENSKTTSEFVKPPGKPIKGRLSKEKKKRIKKSKQNIYACKSN